MEIFMGSVLTGDNAGYPSPYDFALGGQGLDPALPATGSEIVMQSLLYSDFRYSFYL